MEPAKKQMTAPKCTAVKRDGQRCRAIAGPGGFCHAHSGKVDMRELGSRGGRASVRSRLGLNFADDDLRAKARARLNDMLDSPSEQIRMRAAASLFSYSTTAPPSTGAPSGPPASVQHEVAAIQSILEEAGVLDQGAAELRELDDAAIRRHIASLEAELERRRGDT